MLQHVNLHEDTIYSRVEAFIKIGNVGEERNTISILGMMTCEMPVEIGRRQLTHQSKV